MPSSHIRVSDKVKERLQVLAKELGFKTMGEVVEYLLSFDAYIKKLRELKIKEKLLEVEYKLEMLEKKRELLREMLEMSNEVEECGKLLLQVKQQTKENTTKQQKKPNLVFIYNYILAYILVNILPQKDKEKILSLSEEEAVKYLKKMFPKLPVTVESIRLASEQLDNLENKPLLQMLKELEKTI